MRTQIGPPLKRYHQQAQWPSGKIDGGFVDWFTDDHDAAETSRVQMEEQGYKVLSVRVENQVVTTFIE